MAMNVDEDLKKAFSELQMKMVDTKHKLMAADIEIEKFKRIQHHSGIVLKDVECLPSGTRLFYSIGRMYLLEKPENINTILNSKKQYAVNRINEIEDGKNLLQKSLKDSENNLREMVQQKRRG